MRKEIEREIKNCKFKYCGVIESCVDCMIRRAKIQILKLWEEDKIRWLEERGRMSKLLFERGVRNW